MTGAKIVGEVNWILQPGYPQVSGEEEAETLVVQYIAGNDLLPSVLPEYGTEFYDQNWPFFNALNHLKLSDRAIDAMEGRYTYEVTLTYTVPPEDEEVSYQTMELSVAIEKHPDYLTNWNYSLLIKDGIETSPDWWLTAINTKISEADSKNYAWAKDGDKVPDGWRRHIAPTKPGVEIYQTEVPVVTVIRRSVYKDDLQEIAGNDNKISTPPKTFGYTGEWLQSGSAMQKEGLYWVLTTQYTGSKDIDEDIYETASQGI